MMNTQGVLVSLFPFIVINIYHLYQFFSDTSNIINVTNFSICLISYVFAILFTPLSIYNVLLLSIVFALITFGLIYAQSENRCGSLSKKPNSSELAKNSLIMLVVSLIGLIIYMFVFTKLLSDPYIKVIEGAEASYETASGISKIVANGSNITLILWLVNSLYFYKNVCI
jgi:hypothetical protein